MSQNLIYELAERGYRGKPELEAVDRKLQAEYQARANTQSRRVMRIEVDGRVFVGLAVLIVLFFVCYGVFLKVMMKDAYSDAQQMQQQMLRVPKF